MTYEDLLVVPWVDKGRTLDGLDCYGIVLELCNRAGTPLKDICDDGIIEGKRIAAVCNVFERRRKRSFPERVYHSVRL